MAKIICYTSPARGHLFPTMPILLELARRGHDVVLYTLAEEVERVRQTGLRVEAISKAVESIALDDHLAKSPPAAIGRAVRVFVARARHEVPELEAAIRDERPDGLLIDFNSWGASSVAERSGLPWALFMPYFLPWRLPGLPPFGPGLAPRSDWVGRVRDFLVGKLVDRVLDKHLGPLNDLRVDLGLPALPRMTDYGHAAPRILYYTAEPFAYACPGMPANVISVGPLLWDPPSQAPQWLESIDRPLVLVTCSTEFQADGAIAGTALEALAGEDVFVVATTASVDPSTFAAPANARVERFVPHAHLLGRAACVVCHGGMGITQKALAAGVPVCVVPFGRDQLEVARHVEVAGAGVRVDPKKMTPARLRAAVSAARAKKAGALRIAEAFRTAGGASRAVDELERLVGHARPAAPAETTSTVSATVG